LETLPFVNDYFRCIIFLGTCPLEKVEHHEGHYQVIKIIDYAEYI